MHSCWVPGNVLYILRVEGLLYVTAINLANLNTCLVVGHTPTRVKCPLVDLWKEAPLSTPAHCLCQ